MPMKPGVDTGSFVNMMSNDERFRAVKVGVDVTELLWTDRNAWRITDVDKDGKGFTMTEYAPVFIGSGYGDERYRYTDGDGNPLLSNRTKHVRYRYKKWAEECGKYNGKTIFETIHLAFNMREKYVDPSF